MPQYEQVFAKSVKELLDALENIKSKSSDKVRIFGIFSGSLEESTGESWCIDCRKGAIRFYFNNLVVQILIQIYISSNEHYLLITYSNILHKRVYFDDNFIIINNLIKDKILLLFNFNLSLLTILN